MRRARATGKWLLDPYAPDTHVATVSEGKINECLDALQVRGYPGQPSEQVMRAAIVALVEHLKRLGGFTRAIGPDDDGPDDDGPDDDDSGVDSGPPPLAGSGTGDQYEAEPRVGYRVIEG